MRCHPAKGLRDAFHSYWEAGQQQGSSRAARLLVLSAPLHAWYEKCPPWDTERADMGFGTLQVRSTEEASLFDKSQAGLFALTKTLHMTMDPVYAAGSFCTS